MVQTIIEIFYDTDADGELILAGDGDKATYEELKQYISAVEHNMNNGVSSTLYQVSDDAPQSAIDEMTAAHDWHFNHGIKNGVIRGIEIQPGTPTDTEADDLAERILDAGGPDITIDQPSYEPSVHIYNDLPDDALDVAEPDWSQDGEPGAGGGPVLSDTDPDKPVIDVIKNDFPSIGEGNWRCVHPDHSSPEVNNRGDECSLGHSDERRENEYAQQHRNPFDPTTFL
jgi:hypothetical protein